jgi:hypothetical protein
MMEHRFSQVQMSLLRRQGKLEQQIRLVMYLASRNRHSGLVTAEAHVAHDLQGAHPLFAGQHQVGDFEPVPQRLVRIFEDCASDATKTVSMRRTGPALPMEGLVGGMVVKLDIPAARDSSHDCTKVKRQMRRAPIASLDSLGSECPLDKNLVRYGDI